MAQHSRSDIERMLQEEFPAQELQFTSTAQDPRTSEYIRELARPVESRGRVPMTREAFVISENPARVEWEREVRIFLAQLSPESAHRVTAPMIYEWTTGISIKELVKAEGVDTTKVRGGAASGSANMHLRHINWVLREYFGQPHKTTIAGRSVGKAYAVRKWFKIRHKKPANLTLIPDFEAGTLDPR